VVEKPKELFGEEETYKISLPEIIDPKGSTIVRIDKQWQLSKDCEKLQEVPKWLNLDMNSWNEGNKVNKIIKITSESKVSQTVVV
jgi:hypothetical protein